MYSVYAAASVCHLYLKKGDKELDQQQFDFEIIKYVMYNRRLCLA